MVGSKELSSDRYLQALQKGEVDVAVLPSRHLEEFEGQPGAIFNQPLFFPNLKSLSAYQRSYAGQATLTSLFEVKAIGLGFWNHGFTYLASKRPIKRMADFKGRRVISRGPELAQTMLKYLGATPVPLLGDSEVYAALKARDADTAEVSLQTMLKFPKGAGYKVTDLPYRPQVGIVAASLPFWDRLSEREKFALAAIVDEAASLANERTMANEAKARKALFQGGIELPAVPKAERKAFYKQAAAVFIQNRPSVSRNLAKEARLRASPWRRSRPVIRNVVPVVDWSPGEASCPAQAKPREVFFVTNRKPEEDERDGRFVFGARRDEKMHFGVATVAFQPGRRVGGEQRRYFRWQNVSIAPDEAALLGRLLVKALCTDAKEVLIFVHGFNNSFEDAIRRTASIAEDIKFRGPAIAFTWPTEGAAVAYGKDRDSALYSADYFKVFLEALVEGGGIGNVHLLSHSMGSRVVIFGLKYLNARGGSRSGTVLLSNAIFGAPEIDRDLFRQNVPVLARSTNRVTLYASENDRSLKLARALNSDAPRAGDIGDMGILLSGGVDSIDASNVDTSFFAFRHDYIASRPATLYDVFQIVHFGLAPDDRFGLEPSPDGRPFWRFRPQ